MDRTKQANSCWNDIMRLLTKTIWTYKYCHVLNLFCVIFNYAILCLLYSLWSMQVNRCMLYSILIRYISNINSYIVATRLFPCAIYRSLWNNYSLKINLSRQNTNISWLLEITEYIYYNCSCIVHNMGQILPAILTIIETIFKTYTFFNDRIKTCV